jgi:hypothetical protein
MALGSTQPLTKMSTRNSDRCVGLTNLPPSCADCIKIWEPQFPGTLRTCPRLYRDCLLSPIKPRPIRSISCTIRYPLPVILPFDAIQHAAASFVKSTSKQWTKQLSNLTTRNCDSVQHVTVLVPIHSITHTVTLIPTGNAYEYKLRDWFL